MENRENRGNEKNVPPDVEHHDGRYGKGNVEDFSPGKYTGHRYIQTAGSFREKERLRFSLAMVGKKCAGLCETCFRWIAGISSDDEH